MSYPPPYGQQPPGGQPPYGQQPWQPYGGSSQDQPYGVQPQYLQQPYGAQPPAGPPTPPPMTEPPQTMLWAKWAMWLGAALTMLYTPASLVDMLVVDPDEWADTSADFGSGSSTLLVLGALFGVLFSVLFAALWVLIARACTRGQEWARITGSVLFALWVLTFLCGLVAATLGLALVVNVLLVLAGAAAVLFLWLPDSNAWFRQHKTPRYHA